MENKKPLWIPVVSALLIHYVLLVIGTLLPFKASKAYVSTTHSWFDHFLQWDGQWYLLIGKYGYNFPETTMTILRRLGNKPPIGASMTTSFFPFPALLFHLFGAIGATVFANLIFISATILLAVWLELHNRHIWIGLMLFTLNPASVFQSIVYPEAFIPFFTLVVIIALERYQKQWFLACIAGFLSGLTSGLGAIIGIFALDFFRQKQWLKGIVYGLSVSVSWVVFSLFLSAHHISALSYLHAEKYWHRVWCYPFAAYLAQFHSSYAPGRYDQVIVGAFTVMFLGYLWQTFKAIDVASGTFLWAYMYFLLSVTTYLIPYPIISQMRYLSVVFPLYGLVYVNSKMTKIYFALTVVSAFLYLYGVLVFTHAYTYQ